MKLLSYNYKELAGNTFGAHVKGEEKCFVFLNTNIFGHLVPCSSLTQTAQTKISPILAYTHVSCQNIV
jgi:hypothetical protein